MSAKSLSVFSPWFVVLAVACSAQDGETESPEWRTWTSSNGQYTVEATMVEYAGGKLQLQKRGGDTVSVDLSRLSSADQRWVRNELARRRAEAKRATTAENQAGITAADWPGFRGPARDGKSPDTGLLKQWPSPGPQRLWQVDDIGKGFSSVAVSKDTVYITGDRNGRLNLLALDLDGETRWRVEIDEAWTKSHPGARSTPTVDGASVYLVSGHGLVGCYDVRNGRQKWTQQLRQFGGSVPGWGYSESVLIHDGLAVVTPGGQKCIVALDKSSGRPVWSSQGFRAGAQYSSNYAFTFHNVPVIVNGTSKGIVCIAAEGGRMLWSNPFSADNTANCPTPVYSDGYVFWANGYGKGGICLKLAAGRGGVTAQQAWTTRDMVCHHGGYVIHEGHIYGNHSNGWTCLDLQSGERLWQERGVGKGSVCWADGMLYLFGENGGEVGLATCSPDGMEMKGSFRVNGDGPSWAHPVVTGGRLYVRYDTHLYCYDVRAR